MQSIQQAVRAGRPARVVERGLTLGLALWAGSVVPQTVHAQECPTTGPLPLYSPETLGIDFEQTGTLGNRLVWPAVDPAFGSCARLAIPSDLESRIGVRLEGDFLDVFDRRIGVEFTAGGTVATTASSEVPVTVQNSHPNPAATNINVTLNLSGRGGIFRWNPATGRAPQVNDGVPTYLPSTNVRSLAMSRDGSRIYAGITQVPLLRSDDGGPWVETTVGPPPFSVEPEAIVVSPNDPDRLWVRSNRRGLWRSEDAGETWQLEIGISREPNVDYRMMKQIDVIPPGGTQPQPVIFVYARGLGLYYSVDDGNSWQVATGLEVPVTRVESGFEVIDCFDFETAESIEIFDVEASRVDPGKIYVAVQDWGVYEVDVQGGFEEWTPRFRGLVVCNERPIELPLGRKRSVNDVLVLEPIGSGENAVDQLVALSDLPPIAPNADPENPLPVTIAFTSNDGGETWDERASNYPADAPNLPIRSTTIFRHPDTVDEPRTVVAAVRERGLWQLRVPTDDTVASWQPVTYEADAELLNPSIRAALPMPTGEVVVGTINAGTYRLGEPIQIDRAVALATEVDGEPLRTGLSLSFDQPGTIDPGERFEIISQSYQGYAVWRGRTDDPVTGEPEWELIGLYDLSNPETCSEDPCDLVAIEEEPGCFSEKRANCFVLPPDPTDGQWEFFDRDVGAGFSYDYAVSTFDYGFIGDTAPQGSLRDMWFSPRSELESAEQSPESFRELRDGENFNRVFFQVNTVPSDDLSEVWAVPNPFIRRAGWDDTSDNFIRFFNVTETASVEIFTIAGDFVRKIDNVVFNDRETGLIEWDTRNAEGEQVASGVYIWRVTDASGGEEFGRLTLIR